MCMQSGVFWGYIGLLKEICERIKTEHGSKMKIISTGGLGPLFQSAEKVFDEWKDDPVSYTHLTLPTILLV